MRKVPFELDSAELHTDKKKNAFMYVLLKQHTRTKVFQVFFSVHMGVCVFVHQNECIYACLQKHVCVCVCV